MITEKDIINALSEINAPKDKVVTVHTSLKKIGEILGGAQTLLNALIHYFTDEGGLLCIPTHTWGYMDDKDVPTLDLYEPKSNLGVLPNVALQDGRGIRSLHPTHSMIVFGDKEKAVSFVKSDEVTETMVSPEGCYGKIYDMDGYVLLLGVEQDKNTFLHCVEEMLEVKNRVSDQAVETTIKFPDGHIEKRKIFSLYSKGIEDVSLQFTNYEQAFRMHNCITDGKLGNAKIHLCSTRKMKDVMELINYKSGGIELLADKTPIDAKFYS